MPVVETPAVLTDEQLERFRQMLDEIRGERFRVERNSRGHNWYITLVRQDGESEEDVLKRMVAIDAAFEREFGRGA